MYGPKQTWLSSAWLILGWLAQIQVNQQERRLTVSGERGEPEVTGPGSELNDRKRYERPHGKFSRSVQLPEDADTSGVSAR